MRYTDFAQAHDAYLTPPEHCMLEDDEPSKADAFIAALEAPLGHLLREDAPEAGYFDKSPEEMLGEVLVCTQEANLDTAMALLIRAAQGADIRAAATALLKKVAKEYAV